MENKIIILACSGASNTGAYSDRVARKLMSQGKAKMLCLARFSVDEKFSKTSKSDLESMGDSGELVVIDGCNINCAEMIMKNSGITKFKHVNITDFGIVKGKTPVTEDKIDEIIRHILS